MVLLLICLITSAIQLVPQGQTGTLEGIVTSASTSEPIFGSKVRLDAVRLGMSLETTTDGAGRFSFRDIPAGLYQIEVTHEASMGLRVPVAVVAGQLTQAPRLALTRRGAIYGRVLDSDSKGMPAVTVERLRLSGDSQGRKVWARQGQAATTDDDGVYRFPMLGPGSYYLRTILDSGAVSIPVYYPGTAEADTAVPVVLAEGAEVPADIRIGEALRGNRYRISGTVTPPAEAEPSITINLLLLQRHTAGPIDAAPGRPLSIASQVAESGLARFELRGLPPGDYDLLANARIHGREYLSKMQIEIRGHDIENADLVLRPPLEIQGRLVTDGDPEDIQLWRRPGTGPSRPGRQSRPADVRVDLVRKDGLPFGLHAIDGPVIDASGTRFSFRDIPEGEYAFSLTFLPNPEDPNLYVADIRASGRSVFDNGFVVGVDPVDSMEIVVGTKGGSIEGQLWSADSPIPAVLVVAPEVFRRDNASLYRTMNLYRGEEFAVRGLAPGTYKVFAVPYPNEPLPYRSPEFMARYEHRALTITIEKGARLTGLQVPYLRDEK